MFSVTRTHIALLIIAVICALGAVNSNNRARRLFVALEAEQKRLRDLNIEWGQLQLEQSTWAGHARIEKFARDKLEMRTPLAGQIVLIEIASPADTRPSIQPTPD